MKISARAGKQLLEVTIERHGGVYHVEIDGHVQQVDAQKLEDNFYSFVTEGRSYEVSVEREGDSYRVRHGAAERLVVFSDPGRRAREGFAAQDGPERIVSSMPGKVVRVLVRPGDAVEAGQGVVVVEAMKMENEIVAPKAGTVSEVSVQANQTVESGAVLFVIE